VAVPLRRISGFHHARALIKTTHESAFAVYFTSWVETDECISSAPALIGLGHDVLMAVICLSVYLSVPCLTLYREQKGIGN